MLSVVIYSMFLFVLPAFFIPYSTSAEDQCRQLEFRASSGDEGKRLINHLIRAVDVTIEGLCRTQCFLEPNCVSYNFMRRVGIENHLCELNNFTKEGHDHDLVENPSYVYRGAKDYCGNNLCKNNSTCQTGFTDRGYRCWCTAGFEGQDCEIDIDECTTGTNNCSRDAMCNNTRGSYNCTCNPGYHGDGQNCEDVEECSTETHDCNVDAVCSNARGSYNCTCNHGYYGDGRDCQDTDECNTGTHQCSADAVCNNTKGSYHCTCNPGYYGNGRDCEDINECATGTHSCHINATCNNTKGSFNCSCIPGYFGDGRECISSPCKEIYDRNLTRENRAYQLNVGSDSILAYCHMSDTGLGACGGGGWTLVMKIDGNQQNFRYDSTLWSNKETFNLAGGETGFDSEETKLPIYWNTPFSKICLGMKIGQQINFVVINEQGSSLYSLIADGQYRATSLGRNTWKTLIGSQASLQSNCNKEGFNAVDPSWERARIGILGNNENSCITCDSRIGFGTQGHYDHRYGHNTCGNEAANGVLAENGEKHIRAMGYILVQ